MIVGLTDSEPQVLRGVTRLTTVPKTHPSAADSALDHSMARALRLPPGRGDLHDHPAAAFGAEARRLEGFLTVMVRLAADGAVWHANRLARAVI